MEFSVSRPTGEVKRAHTELIDPQKAARGDRLKRIKPRDPNSPKSASVARSHEKSRKAYFLKELYMGKPESFWE